MRAAHGMGVALGVGVLGRRRLTRRCIATSREWRVAVAVMSTCLSCLLPTGTLTAQKSADASPSPSGALVVKLDPASGTFDKALPFDEDFYVVVPGDHYSVVELSYGYLKHRQTGDVYEPIASRLVLSGNDLRVRGAGFKIGRLLGNRRLRFTFVATEGRDTTATIVAEGRTATTFRDYFRTDLGVVYAPRLLSNGSDWPHYVGGASTVHIYLVPINDEENAEQIRDWGNVWKRVSLTAGLVLFDIRSDVPIDHSFSTGSPTLGLSVRPLLPRHFVFLNAFYLNAGYMFFQQKDANPLITSEHRKHTTFLGVAVGIDWKDVFGPLTALLVGSGK